VLNPHPAPRDCRWWRPVALWLPLVTGSLCLSAAWCQPPLPPLSEPLPGLSEPTAPPPSLSASAARSPFNLHFIVAEDFLNRFIARNQVEPGEVDDFILGAKVDGQQWTATQLHVDLKPSPERALALFILDGHVQSQTIGRTEQGAVHTLGRQQFHAVKEVFFAGQHLSTRHAAVHVRAENRPIGATTRLDGTPLQGLGSRIALKMAERQRPQSEEIARNRVVERVYPSFDKEIDQQLADANDRLDLQLRGLLRRANLLPTQQLARSNETHLHYAGRFVVPDSAVNPAVPTALLAQPHGITVQLHESLLNALLDRLNLKGRKITDREFRQMGAELRSLVRGGSEGDDASDSPPPAIKLDTEIEFDAAQPLVLRFQKSQMELELRATFRPAGQPLLPALSITIPVRLERRPTDEWTLIYGDIAMRPLDGGELPAVTKTVIEQTLRADLPAVSFPAVLTSAAWPADKPRLKLAELQAMEGWLIAGIDAEPIAGPMPVGPAPLGPTPYAPGPFDGRPLGPVLERPTPFPPDEGVPIRARRR